MQQFRTGPDGQDARHRLFLASLAKRKALEREAKARRRGTDESRNEELERGFQICLNGANRECTSEKRKPLPPRTGSRGMLRVPGAPAVPKVPCAEPADLPDERRQRRRWVLGIPVVLKTAEGELLHMEPCRDRAELPPQPT